MDDNFIGFDVSKLSFDLAFEKSTNQWISRKMKYTNEGMNQLLDLLPEGCVCVMEATGPYYLRLAGFLFSKGYKVAVVNPLVIRRYSQMKLLRTKTDKADAKTICMYGREQCPSLWKPKKEEIKHIRQKLSTQQLLIKLHTSLLNKLESMTQDKNVDRSCIRMINQELKNLERKIDKLECEVEELVIKHYEKKYRLLKTIPGIGVKTAITLIAITSGFESFDHHKKLASYVGLCPRIFESGTSVKGKARICKLGMKRVRQLMYLAALTAKDHNKPCAALYERLLAKGKPKKLAIIAVANKLLRQSFGVIKNNLPYYEYSL